MGGEGVVGVDDVAERGRGVYVMTVVRLLLYSIL